MRRLRVPRRRLCAGRVARLPEGAGVDEPTDLSRVSEVAPVMPGVDHNRLPAQRQHGNDGDYEHDHPR
jgi:hypothetical protein